MWGPADPKFRFVFLAMLCFMTFGSYWCYDIPGALTLQFEAAPWSLTSNAINWLYNIYSYMNIVIVLFGGYFIDVIGLRIGAILFCLMIGLGQLIVSFGASFHSYWIMFAGRAVFSLGGESLSVAQSAYCSKWFGGKELALSFGITLSFARIGSFANLNLTPVLAEDISISFAVWFGTLTCIISILLTIFASISDRIRDKKIAIDTAGDEKPAKIPFSPKDILTFPLSLWLIYFVCVLYYIGVFLLISLTGPNYLAYRFGISKPTTILSIPYIMSAAMAPFCGYAVDKVGRKPLWLSLTSFVIIFAYAVLLYGPTIIGYGVAVPIIAMVLIGLSYSLCAASLWPCVPLLVHEDRVGTAYGVMNAIQNAGLALAGTAIGSISDKCMGGRTFDDDSVSPSLKITCSTRPLYLLWLMGVAAFAFTIVLFIVDAARGGTLAKKSGPPSSDDAIIANKDDDVPSETQPLIN